jgi:hypothetical protein
MVFTVSVAFTAEVPMIEAVAGTVHVGAALAALKGALWETAQLSWTVPVNPPAGLIVNVSVAGWPAAAIDSVLLVGDSQKVGAVGGCWTVSGTVSVCWMTPATAVTETL